MKYSIWLEKPNSPEPTFLFFCCRHCSDGKVCKFSLGEKVLPSEWNPEKPYYKK